MSGRLRMEAWIEIATQNFVSELCTVASVWRRGLKLIPSVTDTIGQARRLRMEAWIEIGAYGAFTATWRGRLRMEAWIEMIIPAR